MGQASLETSPKNNMIQDMINSDNMHSTESTILSIFKMADFDKVTKVVALHLSICFYLYQKCLACYQNICTIHVLSLHDFCNLFDF